MWVTLILRYRMEVFSHVALDEVWHARNEWDSLEVYHLVTCFDTLAGKAKHLSFERWLEQNYSGRSFELQEVIALYQDYQDEHGVRRNLKRTFTGFPWLVKKWVTSVFRLLKDNERVAKQDSLDLDVDIQITRLLDHFFEIRNQYTHSSITRSPLVVQSLSPAPEDCRWRYAFALDQDPQDTSRKKFSIYSRGLDEATLLRVLLVVVVAQMLRVEVSEKLINANIAKLARVDALYRFIYELTGNAQALHRWMYSDEGKKEVYRSSLWRGLPDFQTDRTETLIGQLWDNTLERGLREWMQEYFNLLQTANQAIGYFNETHPIFDDRKADEISDEEKARRYREIEDFFNQHEQKWRPILDITSSNQAFNIWMIIRDPSYS